VPFRAKYVHDDAAMQAWKVIEDKRPMKNSLSRYTIYLRKSFPIFYLPLFQKKKLFDNSYLEVPIALKRFEWDWQVGT
jgi:hypothetical protein